MTFFSIFLAAAPKAREVVDLGSLKVEGAARGPEVRLIDAGRLDGTTAERLVFDELADVESRLLGLSPALPSKSATPKKGRTP